MTYEHRPGGAPASPDIDMGVPEVCEKCDRDCPEPCEAFKRLRAIEKTLDDWEKFQSWSRKQGRVEIRKNLEGEE